MLVKLKYKNGLEREIYSSRGLKFNGMRPISLKITLDEKDIENIKNIFKDLDRIRNSLEVR